MSPNHLLNPHCFKRQFYDLGGLIYSGYWDGVDNSSSAVCKGLSLEFHCSPEDMAKSYCRVIGILCYFPDQENGLYSLQQFLHQRETLKVHLNILNSWFLRSNLKHSISKGTDDSLGHGLGPKCTLKNCNINIFEQDTVVFISAQNQQLLITPGA